MKIEYKQLAANRIAQNPLTGDWFVFIGNEKGARYICRTKAQAMKIAAGI